MPYVTSVQQLGREEGREEGRQEGRKEGEAALLRRLLTRRFGVLPEAIGTRLAQASVAQLDTWGERVLDAETLEEVFFNDGQPH